MGCRSGRVLLSGVGGFVLGHEREEGSGGECTIR